MVFQLRCVIRYKPQRSQFCSSAKFQGNDQAHPSGPYAQSQRAKPRGGRRAESENGMGGGVEEEGLRVTLRLACCEV